MIRFACAIGLLAGAASAQSILTLQAPCYPRDVLVARLASKYAEGVRVQALESQGLMFEVFANDSSGTWTAVLSNPQGISCVMAGGDNIDFVPEQLVTPDY